MTIKTQTLVYRLLSVALCAALMLCCVSQFSLAYDIYDYDYYVVLNQDYYFNEDDLLIDLDYAGTSVTEYGGNDEGEWIPTDFEAHTYGTGTGWYNFTKVIYVNVEFFHLDGTSITSYTDRTEIPYQENNEGEAKIFGVDYVDEEYGLEKFVSCHSVFYYHPSYLDINGDPVEIPISPLIYISNTGWDIVIPH